MRTPVPRGKVLGLVLVVLVAVSPLDAIIQDLVFRHVVSHEVRLLSNGLTLLGTTWAAAGALATLAVVSLRTGDAALWSATLGGAGAVAAGGLAAQVVKQVACRARPWLTDGWGVGPSRPDPAAPGAHSFFNWPCLAQNRYHSFPSGHATTAFAVAASLAAIGSPGTRRAWLGAAAGVAASRVLLNAHFLSDVLAGGVIGWWAAGTAGALVHRLGDRLGLPRRAPPGRTERAA